MTKNISNILARCKNKESSAFKDFYDVYKQKVKNICYRYSKDEDETQDIMQETFIKVFENLDKLEDLQKIDGWVKAIAVNTSINHYNNKKKEGNKINEDIDNYANLSDEDGTEEELSASAENIILAIRSLPDDYKIVFNMYVLENYKHKEIADKLGITEDLAKKRYARAKIMIKERL